MTKTAQEIAKVKKKKSKPAKFRKPPEAPRRFKSAFMFFSQAKHPELGAELRKNGEKVAAPVVAKLISKAWAEIDPTEKEVWELKAEKDKKRYEVEVSLYTGPWKVPVSTRTKKDPDAPKRPMSAFLGYSKAMRSSVQQEHPHLSNTEVSKLLGKMWREATPEEQRKYQEVEAGNREIYKAKMAKWRVKKKEEMNSQRIRREEMAHEIVAKGGTNPEMTSREPRHNYAPTHFRSAATPHETDGRIQPSTSGLNPPYTHASQDTGRTQEYAAHGPYYNGICGGYDGGHYSGYAWNENPYSAAPDESHYQKNMASHNDSYYASANRYYMANQTQPYHYGHSSSQMCQDHTHHYASNHTS